MTSFAAFRQGACSETAQWMRGLSVKDFSLLKAQWVLLDGNIEESL